MSKDEKGYSGDERRRPLMDGEKERKAWTEEERKEFEEQYRAYRRLKHFDENVPQSQSKKKRALFHVVGE